MAPWSESNIHARVADSEILRYAVWHDGGSSAICTKRGYNRGTYHETLGTDAAMCRMGIEAPRYGITKASCLERGWSWKTGAAFSQRRLP